MASRQYLEALVKLLKSLVTDRDHERARGVAGGARGPKGVEAEELIGAARITPRTLRGNTDEGIYDLHEMMHLLATAQKNNEKRKQVFANAHNFIKQEMLRRKFEHEDEDHEFVDVSDVHVNQLIPEIVEDEVSMPLPGEHSCRMASPGQFSRFRRNNSTSPHTIIGFKSGGGSSLQSFRYPKESWTAERARNHCESHDGHFEGASE